MNTIVQDDTGEVVLSNNQFTLPAGRYIIRASAPAYRVDWHYIRLMNITDNVVEKIGNNAYSLSTTDGTLDISNLTKTLIVDNNKMFEIQHKSQTSYSANGFGVPHGTDSEIYTTVEIIRLGDA